MVKIGGKKEKKRKNIYFWCKVLVMVLTLVLSGVAFYSHSSEKGKSVVGESKGGSFALSLVPPPFVSVAGAAETAGRDGAAFQAWGVDVELVNMIEELAPDYYDESWNVSLSQYKAWIATITLRESGRGRYAAHSQYGGSWSKDRGLTGDRFDHNEVGNEFRFSTGIGAFQLDRGGSQGTAEENWGIMPTIEKMDPKLSLISVLRWHRDRFKGWGAAATLANFSKYSAWLAVKNESKFAKTWEDITGYDWYECKEKKIDVEFHPPTVNDPFENSVKYIGKAYRNLSGWEGYFDTWLVMPRSWSGNEVTEGGYYYAMNNTDWEAWVWNDPNNEFIYIFERKYDQGHFPENRQPATICIGNDRAIATAGITCDSPALDPNKILRETPTVTLKADQTTVDAGGKLWGIRIVGNPTDYTWRLLYVYEITNSAGYLMDWGWRSGYLDAHQAHYTRGYIYIPTWVTPDVYTYTAALYDVSTGKQLDCDSISFQVIGIASKNARLYLPETFENTFFCYHSQRVFGDTVGTGKLYIRHVSYQDSNNILSKETSE